MTRLDPFFVAVVFRCVAVLLEADAVDFFGAAETVFFAAVPPLDGAALDAEVVFGAAFFAEAEVAFLGVAVGAVFLAGAVVSAASESSGQPIKAMAAAATNNGRIR